MEKWAVFLHDVYEFQIYCLSILLSALQGDVLSSCWGTGTLSKALRRSCNSITWMFHCGVLSLFTKVSVTHADISHTCFRIQELQEEVQQLQEKLAQMEKGVLDYSKQVGF